MEEVKKNKITAFDSYYTTNSLRILKILTSYLDYETSPYLALYIKYMEMRICLDLLPKKSKHNHNKSFFDKDFDTDSFINEIKPCLSKQSAEMVNQFQTMKNMMNMYSEMSEIMNMAQADNSSDNSGGFNKEILKGMLSPEQANMFDLLEPLLNNQEETKKEGKE